MKRSITPTPYILVRAASSGPWDTVDFAVIHLTESWKAALAQRLLALTSFAEDESFHNLTYWESPLGFYCHPTSRLYTEKLMHPQEEWTFVTLTANQEQRFPVPVDELEGHQLVITKHGFANFIAYNKRTGEQYWTEWFSIAQLIGKHRIRNVKETEISSL